MKKLILIKLGGSVITDKGKAFTSRPLVIKRLAKEIKIAREKLGKDTLFLIGHGSGSFGHTIASKYQTQKGLINKRSLAGSAGKESVKGFCLTADAAIEINRIVIKEFLKIGLPVAAFSPLSFLYAKKNKLYKFMLNNIKKCFDIGIIPVIYGDVIMDESMDFCIFSAEKTLGVLARKLRKIYKIEKIVECGDTDGVYDAKGKTIGVINNKNFNKIRKDISGSKSTDVTGGMIHKVEESLKLARETKIKTLIINGNRGGDLVKAILGKKVKSTQISV